MRSKPTNLAAAGGEGAVAAKEVWSVCGVDHPPTVAVGGGRDHTRARGGWGPPRMAGGLDQEGDEAGEWRDRRDQPRGLPRLKLYRHKVAPRSYEYIVMCHV